VQDAEFVQVMVRPLVSMTMIEKIMGGGAHDRGGPMSTGLAVALNVFPAPSSLPTVLGPLEIHVDM